MNATRRPGCKAVQHSDQMCCGQCGLAWDVNDPEPPQCRGDHLRPGYVDTETMRVAFTVKTLFEHDLTADMTKYYYDLRAGTYGLDPWYIVDGIDQSTSTPDVFFIDTLPGRATFSCGPDQILFLGAKDAAKVKEYDRYSPDTLEAAMRACGNAMAKAIRDLLTCSDSELKPARNHLKSLFDK